MIGYIFSQEMRRVRSKRTGHISLRDLQWLRSCFEADLKRKESWFVGRLISYTQHNFVPFKTLIEKLRY